MRCQSYYCLAVLLGYPNNLPILGSQVNLFQITPSMTTQGMSGGSFFNTESLYPSQAAYLLLVDMFE